MIHRLTLLAFLAVSSVLHAGEPPAEMKNALATVPSTAAGFVMVPNIKQLDADLAEGVANFDLQDLVPPGMVSVTGLLRQYLSISEGLNAEGPLVVAFIPGAGVMDTAFVLPATDPAGLLKAMGGQEGEGGAWTVSPMGQPKHAVTAGGKVIIADSAEVAKSVSAPSASITERMQASDFSALKGQDFSVWIDGERMIGQFRPQIDGIMSMAMMMQGGGNPGAMEQAQNAQKEIKVLLDGMRSAGMGLNVDAKGLGMRFLFTCRPGTEFAKRMKHNRTTTESMLTGLPASKFMVAGGLVFKPEAMRMMMEQLQPIFKQLSDDVSDANKARVTGVQELAGEMAVMVTGARASISHLPTDSGSLLGVAGLLDVTDSKKFIAALAKVIEEVEKVDPGEDEEAQQIIEALSFEPGKETIESLDVAHLKLDVEKFDLEDEEYEEIGTVIGADGFLFRVAAVNEKTVVLSVGGGSDFMKTLIQQAKSGKAPLEKDPGVQRVAGQLPKERAAAVYAAFDRIVACVQDGQKRLDEDPLPVGMETINAPMLVVSTAEESWSQADIYLPTELIVAGKQFLQAMFQGPPAPPEPAPAG